MKQVVIPSNRAQAIIADLVNGQRTKPYHYKVDHDQRGVLLTSKEEGAMNALVGFLAGAAPGQYEVEEIPE